MIKKERGLLWISTKKYFETQMNFRHYEIESEKSISEEIPEDAEALWSE